MSCDSEKQLKELFVKGIKDGLSDALADAHSKRGQFHNARNFDKIDSIMNNIIKKLDKNKDIKCLVLPRGGYEVLLVFDHNDMQLYSFMSERRFKEIYNKIDESIHYIHGLVKYNEGYERQQTIMDESIFSDKNNKLQSLTRLIDDVLVDKKPNKYYTVVFHMNGYDLLGVKCILTSEYMEIVSEENWSELINIDYGDINYNDYNAFMSEYDLGITLKTNYISDENDIEDKITPKEIAEEK